MTLPKENYFDLVSQNWIDSQKHMVLEFIAILLSYHHETTKEREMMIIA